MRPQATTMPTLRLNCVIKGEDKAFTVITAAGDDNVSILKEHIQEKRARGTLKGVDPHDLELWKPRDSSPIPAMPADTLVERIESMGDDLLNFADKLDPMEDLSSIFSTQPPRGCIHIIVQVPISERPFKRTRFDPGTIDAKDSSPRLDRPQTEDKIAEALAGFEKYFEYLATGKLDGRLDSIRPEDKLKKLVVNLPINPILLLHDLGKHPDQKRIEGLFKPNPFGTCTITHLFSVSGSGKTRLSLDGLCYHWGLYISCKPMQGTASGSGDFTVATKMLQSMSNWRADPPDFSNNSTAAHRTFAMLLCARVVILGQLVKQFPVKTNVLDARRRWVLAQVLPPRLVGKNQDLFITVLRALRNADTDIMLDIVEALLGDIMTKRKELFPEGTETPLFTVIDEAQVAAECLKCFPSMTGEGLRPILREMVSFFQSTLIFNKIILSGTGLSMEMVKGAAGSLSAKAAPTLAQDVFSDVGCFTREDPSQEAYIRRYLTLSDNDISDKRLLERMKFWFCGRYRLTASLIEIFLYSENVPRHRVLTSFAKRLTGFQITDAIELEAGEPHISPDLDKTIKNYRPLTELYRLFEEEGLSERMELINCLTDALMRWTLGSELTSIPIENRMQEMISLGVGFLAKMPSILENDVNVPVYISEPLAVLSLRTIFETQRCTTMKVQMNRLFRNALNPSGVGYVLETALPLVLMETFGGKFSPLEEAFIFKPGSSLGSRRVTLVSLKRIASGELQTCPVSWDKGSSDRLGLKAESPAHVLEFFDNPDGKVFIFPDNYMHPDLSWFFQDEETKELILCFDQSKLTLNSKTWKKAIQALTPQFFYMMTKKGEQVQYAPMLYPDLLCDLKVTLEMAFGEGAGAPEVVHSYFTRSKTKVTSPSTPRETPRYLCIISSPDDDQKQRLNGEGGNLALLRWDKMEEYFGSTIDSVSRLE